jgi:hypothetical protein
MLNGQDAGIAKLLVSGDETRDRVTGRPIKHAGMGIVLDSRHILTCAHVVNAALGRPNESSPEPELKVPVAFPLSKTTESVLGQVVSWHPMGPEETADIAILELDSDVPQDVGFAKFMAGDEYSVGALLMVFGVRAGYERGNHVEAKLMGRTAVGQMQIDGTSMVGVFVQGGFSGAGVLDKARQRIVGMVVARDFDSADRVAYMIPIPALQLAWPDIARQVDKGISSIFGEYIGKKTQGFVGRDHAFARIQNFLNAHDRGYLTLVGDPGIGKTSILCELTRRMPCFPFFFIRLDGITQTDQFYAHIGDQLRQRFGIDTSSRGRGPAGIRLIGWLKEASESLGKERLILVIDALDESDETLAKNNSGNLLLLPRILPKSVYVIMSRRNLDPAAFHIRLETEPEIANEIFDLMTYPAENRRDVEQYLTSYFVEHPEHPWLARHNKTPAEAVAVLSEGSQCNFMYLRHVLPHLIQNPEEFSPKSLPKGLEEYYFGHWQRMTEKWQDKSEAEFVFDAIYIIAVAQRPITRSQLTAILPDVPAVLFGTLISQWREFLDEAIRQETAYRIYHASFADFLLKRDTVQDAGIRQQQASRRLKTWFLNRMRIGGQRR